MMRRSCKRSTAEYTLHLLVHIEDYTASLSSFYWQEESTNHSDTQSHVTLWSKGCVNIRSSLGEGSESLWWSCMSLGRLASPGLPDKTAVQNPLSLFLIFIYCQVHTEIEISFASVTCICPEHVFICRRNTKQQSIWRKPTQAWEEHANSL